MVWTILIPIETVRNIRFDELKIARPEIRQVAISVNIVTNTIAFGDTFVKCLSDNDLVPKAKRYPTSFVDSMKP